MLYWFFMQEGEGAEVVTNQIPPGADLAAVVWVGETMKMTTTDYEAMVSISAVRDRLMGIKVRAGRTMQDHNLVAVIWRLYRCWLVILLQCFHEKMWTFWGVLFRITGVLSWHVTVLGLCLFMLLIPLEWFLIVQFKWEILGNLSPFFTR